jgi:acylpyruvate hydrolase
MRIATVRTDRGLRAARVEGDELVLLDASDIGALLAEPDWQQIARRGRDRRSAAGAEFAAVVPRPEKIICVGLNYRSHAEETGLDVPDHPAIFAKYSGALIGPRDPIVLPANSDKVDWEAELCIIVGKHARYASEDEAADSIAGYTIANDISMRDWQSRTSQWLQGKTFEASTPIGPNLVTLNELATPDSLAISCTVDGIEVQAASTRDLIFSPAMIISYLSSIITLVPGDLILTGTPAGIGARRKPPRFLRPGEVVRTTIEGLGELVNPCVQGL